VVLVRTTQDRGSREARTGFLAGGAERDRLREFRDGFFSYLGSQIKDFFEELKEGSRPISS